MTRSLLLIVALLCTGASLHAPAQADAASAARQAIQADYNKMLAAMQHRDAQAFLAYLTLDFRAIGRDGKAMTRTQLANLFKQLKTEKDHTSPRMTVRIRQITLHGREATVVQEQLTGSSSSGSLHRDLWITTGQGWRIKQSKEMPRK